MWEGMVERAAREPELGFFHKLFSIQQKTWERFEELMAGERQPLGAGVLMASIAFVGKTHRELYPLIERAGPEPARRGLASLRRATSDDLLELLAVYYLDDRIPRAALVHLDDEPLCRWFARIFLLPAAPHMLGRTPADPSVPPMQCPRCRHRPQYVRGERVRVCSMCWFEWTPAGDDCPCGGSWAALDAVSTGCSRCRRYLRRADGLVEALIAADRPGWTELVPSLRIRS